MSHDLIGRAIGQYVPQELTDHNGVVLTYRAFQERLNRHVSLQTLDAQFRADPIFIGGFRRGAELIASFEHPNIVPIIDYGQEGDFPYIVIRSMQGGLLRDRMRQGVALSFSEVAGIIRQIGSALDHVHSTGHVHGDPSPLNIGFDRSGGAYITDFINIGILMTSPQADLYGSVRYVAPERWDRQLPTPHSDQYALAAVAYHLLTGQPVFEVDHILAYEYKHRNETPPPPQTHRLDVPLAVNDIFLRALAKDPTDRYLTITDFTRALEQALNSVQQQLFISYSRRDVDYVRFLRTHLTENGFSVWVDDQIEHGDQWFNQINAAIKACAAFLVVMTPDAESSEWVQKEILLAKRYQKPVFPLLLDLQFADVRAGDMPGQEFHRRVQSVVYGAG
jgi:serine/threonine protein kinase